jgi:glucan biosynthesis protein C
MDAARSCAAGGERLDALDASRGLLMLLGLVIHAAAPYRAPGGWLVDEPGGSEWLTQASTWISTFRMPAFFLLAGLLSAWALERRRGWTFLARRSGRLLLPLAACALTVNLLQQAWLDGHRAAECVAAGPCAVNAAAAPWLGHLWFLLDLFVYTAILVAVAPWLKPVALAAQRAFGALPRALAGPTLVLLPLAALFAWSLGIGAATLALDVLDRPLLGFWSFSWVAGHLFFFLAGALLAALPTMRSLLSAPVPLAVPLVSGALGTLAFALRHALVLPRDTLGGKIAFELLDAVPTVLLTVFAISACLRLHRHARSLSGLVARWSYSVYLFHHVVAVGVALWLLDAPLPMPAKFLVTLAAVALLPVLAAAAIERSRALTLLFNGEWRVPARARGAAAGAGSPRTAATAAPAPAPGSGAWVLELLETPVRAPAAEPRPADSAAPDRLAG